jgi:Mlc titration factor MtfA (ptsG expression regulator)
MPPWTRWWQQFRLRRETAAVQRRAIPDALWKRTLVRYPFLQRRDEDDRQELRRLTSLFLDRKEFSTAGGLRLTDAMAVAIAAQACLPVLRLGLDPYNGFVGIVIHPDAVVAKREVVDEDGVLHAYDEVLAGEAMEGGPVMLSWPDVRQGGLLAVNTRTEVDVGGETGVDKGRGYNVVIHEFAHVLDMAHGGANGMPALPQDLSAVLWSETMRRELHSLQARVEDGQDTVLDPYGTTGPEEFFAVASEAFFVTPAGMQSEHPALYALFCRYYRQDPVQDRPPSRRRD